MSKIQNWAKKERGTSFRVTNPNFQVLILPFSQIYIRNSLPTEKMAFYHQDMYD